MRAATAFRLLLTAACFFLPLALHAEAITTVQQAITRADGLLKAFGWTTNFPAKVTVPATKSGNWIVEYQAPNLTVSYGQYFRFDGQTGDLLAARNSNCWYKNSSTDTTISSTRAQELSRKYLKAVGIDPDSLTPEYIRLVKEHAPGKAMFWAVIYRPIYHGYLSLGFDNTIQINPTDGTLFCLSIQQKFIAPKSFDVLIAKNKAEEIAAKYKEDNLKNQDEKLRSSKLMIVPVVDLKNNESLIESRLAWVVTFNLIEVRIDAANGKIL